MSKLLNAARAGNFIEVKRLVDCGADVNYRNLFPDDSPLYSAASCGSLEIVKYLVENGADVNCEDNIVGSPLHFAASSGSLQIVKYLVENRVDINCEAYLVGTPLHTAASSGSLEIVKYLVERGGNVNCQSYVAGSPLQCAVLSGSLEIVKYLVELGVVVTDGDLFLACKAGDSVMVDYLLQRRAIKDMNNSTLESPLRVACRKGHTSVVQTLMRNNVDIRKEKEPLLCGNNEIVNILNAELRKSVKHREKVQILRGIGIENLTKLGPPVKYFSPQKSMILGKGSMGTSVYVGVMEDGTEVAVKRILKEQCEDTAQNELQILSQIDASKSPFIVSYRTVLDDAIFWYIVLDLCEETLKQHIGTQTMEYVKEHGRRMIKEILSGIEFLHNHDILHRDLKPLNVLVDVDGHMRLADFGISRVLKEEETTVHTSAKGTRDWMPTEVIEVVDNKEMGRFKKKSDVQVAGMIAFFILTKGKHPFGDAWIERMTNILKANPVNLKMLHDFEDRKFISWLIRHNIDDRPYAHEALADPFMVHVPLNSRRKVTVERWKPLFSQLN